jgi:hypothetical protein
MWRKTEELSGNSIQKKIVATEEGNKFLQKFEGDIPWNKSLQGNKQNKCYWIIPPLDG